MTARTYVYKILPKPPTWTTGEALPLSDLDRTDGFIHFSTAEQVAGTLDLFFHDNTSLCLLKIRTADLDGHLKYEGPGSVKFPHLYNSIKGIHAEVVDQTIELTRNTSQTWTEVLQSTKLED